MTLFDAYVMVDWSAASRPKRGADSVWIGVANSRGTRLELADPTNPPTRREAEAEIGALLTKLVADGQRVLVGFDFPYGYPRGLAQALGLGSGSAPWRAIWNRLCEHIRDDERNANNRFEVASELNARIGSGPGPFWGCPPTSQTTCLESSRKGRWDFPYAVSGGLDLRRLRETERRMKGVQETWKLLGAGSVGSQALLGIPCVARLRDRPQIAECSRLWPFETGFSSQPTPESRPFVLHAEIWPGAAELEKRLHETRDAAQVLSLSRRLAELDREGSLGHWLGGPPDLSAEGRSACIEEEGWILGA